jgi:hypothetical protein
MNQGWLCRPPTFGQEGVIFTPVARARQAAAVAFLNENAFATPQWAIDKEILRRIEPLGAINRVGSAQRSVLGNLLSGAHFARLVEQDALDGSAAYRPADFLAAVGTASGARSKLRRRPSTLTGGNCSATIWSW